MHDASFFVATLKMADTEPSDMDGGHSQGQGHGRDTMADRVLLLSAVMLERPRHAGERLLGSHLARAMVKAFYHQFPQEVHNSLLFSLKRHAVFHNTIPGVVLDAARGAAEELAGGTPGLVQLAVITHGHILLHAHGPHYAPLAAAITLGATCVSAKQLGAKPAARVALQVNTGPEDAHERPAQREAHSKPLLSLNWSKDPEFSASVALAAATSFEAAAAPCTYAPFPQPLPVQRNAHLPLFAVKLFGDAPSSVALLHSLQLPKAAVVAAAAAGSAPLPVSPRASNPGAAQESRTPSLALSPSREPVRSHSSLARGGAERSNSNRGPILSSLSDEGRSPTAHATETAPGGELVGFTDVQGDDVVDLHDVSIREVSADTDGSSIESLGSSQEAPIAGDTSPPLPPTLVTPSSPLSLGAARSSSFSASAALPSHSDVPTPERLVEEFHDISTVRLGKSVQLVTRVIQVAANTYILTQADEGVMGRVCGDMLEGPGSPRGVQDVVDTLSHVLEGGGRYCLQMQGGDACLTASRDLAISTLGRALLDPRGAADAVRTPLSEVFPVGADLNSPTADAEAPFADWGSSAAQKIAASGL